MSEILGIMGSGLIGRGALVEERRLLRPRRVQQRSDRIYEGSRPYTVHVGFKLFGGSFNFTLAF